jgi:SNF2 family DNA or RNA helicase
VIEALQSIADGSRRRSRRRAHHQVGHRHPQHGRLEEALQVPARRRRRRHRQAERYGGCIIADSVGLGKTFEALAIIKYHELRNDRVLVLCPNACATTGRSTRPTTAATSSRRPLQLRRLNHTDLSRDGGLSGDIDLAHVNWGNYDLVVIDESHNFRNKKTPRQAARPATTA